MNGESFFRRIQSNYSNVANSVSLRQCLFPLFFPSVILLHNLIRIFRFKKHCMNYNNNTTVTNCQYRVMADKIKVN